MPIWEAGQYHIIFFKQDPNKLTEIQNKDGYKYSFLTFTFGTKSDITLTCVKNWLLNSTWVGDCVNTIP